MTRERLPVHGWAVTVAIAAGAAMLSPMRTVAAPAQAPVVELPDPPPPYPDSGGLIPFEVSAASRVRHAVWGPSIAVDERRVVRFALVVRSSGGVDNVSYEAIDCATASRRLLAIGRTDRSWGASASSTWHAIGGTTAYEPQYRLLLARFCAGGAAAGDAAALAARLRSGREDLP